MTLWKRIGNSPIMPYDRADQFDLVIIFVRHDQNLGYFVFTKDVLYKKGFISQDGKGGKRAMRVYPPWDKPDNSQAKKTQAWQELYFVEIAPVINVDKFKKLLTK